MSAAVRTPGAEPRTGAGPRAGGGAGPRAGVEPRAGRTPGTGLRPLYKRLPRGPHRLGREGVVRNQRARICGAMIEAVARYGYEGTNVKKMLALAGVSKRAFYEHFTGKQECFLITCDLIARHEIQQLRQVYLATDGTPQERMSTAFKKLARLLVTDRNRAVLVVLEAPGAGPAGVRYLCRATVACEQMLAKGFAESPGAILLPAPILRAMAGGLHGIASAFLREQRSTTRGLGLAEEMLRWTTLWQNPATERLDAALSRRVREISSISLANGHGLAGASTGGHGPGGVEATSGDERARLEHGVLWLATQEDCRELAGVGIADAAGVSIDVFLELFDSAQECYLAALDTICEELLTSAADPDLVEGDWACAVRRVLARLMGHLAAHPLHARTIVQEAYFAGQEARERITELSHGIATLLTEGAPCKAPGRFTTEAVAGAIWHTIRREVLCGRTQLLPALSDHLAYVVLAPFIGPDSAVETIAPPTPVAAVEARSRPTRAPVC